MIPAISRWASNKPKSEFLLEMKEYLSGVLIWRPIGQTVDSHETNPYFCFPCCQTDICQSLNRYAPPVSAPAACWACCPPSHNVSDSNRPHLKPTAPESRTLTASSRDGVLWLCFFSGLVNKHKWNAHFHTQNNDFFFVVLWNVALTLLRLHNWGLKKDPDMKYSQMLFAQECSWRDI